ncbi:MAG TPA: helicase-related protein [Pyrinomonadaceae bacterium]|nr:helicase-related protein [Pyrinomonadaceae bacterium]
MDIQVAQNIASVTFDRFDIEAYEMFLRVKQLPESQLEYSYESDAYLVTTPARYASLLGATLPERDASELPMPDFLFDYQVAITRLALDARRFAVWADCGLGKTLIELEWARQVAHLTGGRVLIITLNEVVPQMLDEAALFYGDSLPIHLHRIETREEMRRWCVEGEGQIAITNYEKMNPDEGGQVVNELRHLAGLVLDESSRLRAGGGKQKWALIKSSKGIPYKLSATATPAPNDIIEFASQASFLERMRDEGEIIWTYFTRDPKTHEWTVKRHARKAFFEWMSSWSIYIRDPRRYGWGLNVELPPEPVTIDHRIEATPAQTEMMLRYATDSHGQLSMFSESKLGIVGRGKFSQIAKGFVYDKPKTHCVESRKPAFVAELIQSEVARGLQVLVWTVFDEESELIVDELAKRGFTDFDLLHGNTPKAKRPEVLNRFRRGESQVLISKSKLLGYGLNFQCCGSMIFSGWSDSFEQFYQAVRRAVRYGQEKSVRVHLPFIPELEGMVLENVREKQAMFETAVTEMEKAYVEARRELRL